MNPILEMKHIMKAFPGVQALDDVTLKIMPKEIHSIVGENGAGKSTLMKILSGVYSKDSGEILLNGKLVEINSPQDAINLGIGTVYQNLNLIPVLSVAENIFMNEFVYKKGIIINHKEIERKTQEVLNLLHSTISPLAKVDSLSVADQQMVAIARVLAKNIKILILDEPTSSLSPAEAQKLFDNVKRLQENGVSTIFISHHMDEIFSICEHVTVLCDGKYVGDWNIDDIDNNRLVKAMIGRDIEISEPRKMSTNTEEILKIEHLTSGEWVRDVSFSVKKGEIFGIGGLVGAGRTWMAKCIFGAVSDWTGAVTIEGKEVDIKTCEDAVNHGIAFVPEDRRNEGLVSQMSIMENIGLCNLKKITSKGILNKKKEEKLATEVIKNMNVKTPSIGQIVKNLSGGNQQKVVLGKWFITNPKIMIFDEPTRGIDVGAKSEIYKEIENMAELGIAIIVISSELPELINLSDRIMVLSKGKKTAEFKRDEFNAEKIMLAATSN